MEMILLQVAVAQVKQQVKQSGQWINPWLLQFMRWSILRQDAEPWVVPDVSMECVWILDKKYLGVDKHCVIRWMQFVVQRHYAHCSVPKGLHHSWFPTQAFVVCMNS